MKEDGLTDDEIELLDDINNHDLPETASPPTSLQDDEGEEEIYSLPRPPPAPKAPLLTIEPILILYILAGGLAWPAVSSLTYRKVCLSHYNVTICDQLHRNVNHVEEDVVQSETSHWFLWSTYFYEIPTIIMALVYGSLSDRTSRRLAIVLPILGQIISYVNVILNAVYMDWWVGYMMVGSFLSGLSGGWVTLFLACFSYLASVTTKEQRTKRVLVNEAISGLSGTLPVFLSGLILDHTSYLFVFSLTIIIFSFSLLYIYFCMNEPPKVKLKEGEGEEKAGSWWRSFYLPFIHPFLTIFKKRRRNGRPRLLACIFIVFSSMVSMNAYYTVGYLFLKRRPLSWSQTMYGYFLAEAHLLPGLCLLLVITPVRERFNLDDTTLMLTGAIVGPLSEVWLAFSTQTWMVFMMPVIGILRSAGTVTRSTVSKFVETHELGKMYAAFGALQCVSGMVGSTVFNLLYPFTLSPPLWPGFSFCLGAFIAIIPISVILWLRWDLRKDKQSQLEENDLDIDQDANNPLISPDDEDTITIGSQYIGAVVMAEDSYFPNTVLMTNRRKTTELNTVI